MNEKRSTIYHIAFVGVMAALVFVSNYISIPVASSRLHVANAVCLLAGMLFGGVKGGLAAAIGSALFDLTFPAYVAEAWITFINKGAMALVAGLIVRSVPEPSRLRLILGGAAGAALYIALYLLKSYFQIRYVTPVPVETIGPLLLEKLAASSVNGIFAVIVAPLLYTVLAPGIKHLQKS
ncbi:MAG: ECF transporter S component [Eubacteriales bacterium]|nr:ECF transporter S component [Eubacteriales bacterium]MDD4104789.1 ECF transporter S component [Eubacteriales bacterium]MDD4709997.1 ECF transporter S component [Eubacteriales bacterium]NLO14712.1 ECF transporter S component [Clostridiales bacterium]